MQNLQFTAVSEDSLSAAVNLARRDLKKQKEQQQQQEAKKRPKPSHGAKVSHPREYRDRLQRREQRLGKVRRIVLMIFETIESEEEEEGKY